MVALLGFFGTHHGLLELILRRVSGAIDALELLVLLVATVIGAGDVQELERLDLRRVADVGAGTEVDELAVLIKGNGLAGGDVAEATDLVGVLAALTNQLLGFLAGALEALKLLVLLGDAAHLFFDLHEVLSREGMVEVEVVVEPVVGRRPDIELGLRKQAEHGGTQHMGGGVTDLLEGSHLRAGGHGGIPHSLGTPEAEGKDGGEPPPCPGPRAYSLTSSKRIVTTTRMVLSMEKTSTLPESLSSIRSLALIWMMPWAASSKEPR